MRELKLRSDVDDDFVLSLAVGVGERHVLFFENQVLSINIIISIVRIGIYLRYVQLQSAERREDVEVLAAVEQEREVQLVVLTQPVGVLARKVAVLALLGLLLAADGVVELQVVLQHLQRRGLEGTVQTLLVDLVFVGIFLFLAFLLLAVLFDHPHVIICAGIIETLPSCVQLGIWILGGLLVLGHELLRLFLVVRRVNGAVRLDIRVVRRRERAKVALVARRHFMALHVINDLLQ